MKTSDIKLGDRLKILLVGINGSGKTRFWGSFPGPIYCFDFDNRLATIKKDFGDRTDIEYDTYDLSNFKKLDAKLDQFQNKGCPYTTVVVDSITSAATSAVLYSLGETHGKTVAGLSVPSFDEYVVETTTITKLLEILSKVVNGHIVMTAHPVDRMETKTDGKKAIITKVSSIVTYGSKVSSIIPNYLDEVYALRSGKDVNNHAFRTFYTTVNEENDVLAKTSLPLPSKIDWTDSNAFDVLTTTLKERNVIVGTEFTKTKSGF